MSNDIKEKFAELSNEYPADSIWDYCGGGSYKMISVELNATSYEENGFPNFVLRYEQLNDGSFPKGQVWVRSIEDFKASIESNGKKIAKFSRASQ